MDVIKMSDVDKCRKKKELGVALHIPDSFFKD